MSIQFRKSSLKKLSRGFTLIELMVGALITVIILIAVHAFLDQTQWFYVRTEGRSTIQENARMAMEQMERDLRMIGHGVPTGTQVGGTSVWTPVIFNARSDQIYFRAAIENGTAYLAADASNLDTTLSVEDSEYYETNLSGGNVPFVIVEDGRTWQGLECTAASAGSLTLLSPVAADFDASDSEVHTIQHVFYRFVSSATYPFGTIEKAEVFGNTPVTTTTDFNGLASNIVSLTLQYFQSNGTTELTGNPLSDTDSNTVAIILITLVARERSSVAGEYQDYTLRSRVVIRNRNL